MGYRYNCPICSSPVTPDTDYMEHVLMEETAECKSCGLYRSEFCTGNYHLRIGFWEWDWGYTDGINQYARRQVQTEKAIAHTKELLTDPEWPLWKRVTEVWPENEPELFRAFSDWNRDGGRWELADQILVWLGAFLK